MTRIATTLKQIRKEKNLSQGALAHKLGLTTPQYVSNVERGKCSLALGLVKKFDKKDRAKLLEAICHDFITSAAKEVGIEKRRGQLFVGWLQTRGE